MKLTKHNYHSPQNPYISNSKIKLFLQSKEMYKKRYIDHEPQELSRSLKIGQMVDWAFENGDVGVIYKDFPVKVLKRDDPELYEEQKTMDPSEFVTEDERETALEMSQKIISSDLYKWYKEPGMRRYFQKVVHDDRICGMLDVLVVDEKNKVCYIDDLKTSTLGDMGGAKKWHWKCMEYHYYNQMAIYKYLVRQKYPDYEIICRHLVIGSKEPYPIELYIIPAFATDGAMDWIMGKVEEIENEKEWKDHIPEWSEAVELIQPNDTYE